MEEEKPSKSDTTFLITPVAVEGGGAVGGALGVDDAMVVFCIDISGSMCVTTEVIQHVPTYIHTTPLCAFVCVVCLKLLIHMH